MKSAHSLLQDQVFQTLAKYLRTDPARLRPDDSLRDDLGLDSLQTIELVYEVESAFDIQIPDEDFGRMQTVQNVVTYLTERTSNVTISKTPHAGKATAKATRAKKQPGDTRARKRKIS